VANLSDMPPRTVRAGRWTRSEYDRLIDAGLLGSSDRVELLGGQLIVAEPQGSAHFTAIQLAQDALRGAFGGGWQVRVQGPIALDEESEPEPDVVVVPGTARDYRDAHPARPVLLVEVADSSLATDRERKGSLYARAGVSDYWIIDLIDRVLQVHREPAPNPAAPFGWGYRSLTLFRPGSWIEPLAAPGTRIPVADLLP
jgi:Uma2 family endonuclease